VFFESLEITLTIVIGKFFFYGIWEYFHLKEVDMSAVYDTEGHERVDMVVVAVDDAFRALVVEPDDLPPGIA